MAAALPSGQTVAARQFLTFRLDGRGYALPADEVAEVIRLPAIARVPQSPKGLLGLANLRGAVIPVASGRGLLGRADGAVTGQTRAIVLEGAAPLALAVDAVDGLLQIEAASVQTRPAEMAALPGEALRGAFQARAGGEAVKILDLKPLLAAAFTARPRREAGARRGMAEALVQAPAQRQTRLITFEIAGQEFALPLASVQEVAAAPALATAIPHAQSVVLGVVSFRDMLLPLLSLRGLLGFGPGEMRGSEKIVVTRIGGALVGLVADRMTAIVAAEDERMEDIPPVLAARVGGESRIRAIYRGADGRLVSILDTSELFGEEVMRKLDSARGAAGPVPGPSAAGQAVQFVVFRLGEEEFAIPIEAVDEVIRVPDQIARVPKTPKFLEGVVNLRGAVLPVVDQRRRFNMPADESLKGRRLVVVRTERHRAGLIVDSVSEVLRTTQEAIEPAPALSGESSALVRGVLNLGQAGRIVLVLDPAELLTRAEQGLLDKFGREHGAEQPQA